MTSEDPVVQRILDDPVIAILRGVPRDRIVHLAEAIARGGVRVLEVTFTDDDAAEKITLLAEHMPDALLGAGTVTDAQTAQRAVQAGARFLVTPHVVPAVNEFGRAHGLPVVSGALTPGEITSALDQGCELVKVFPAHVMGPEYFRALRGPYPHAALIAVGGIGVDDVQAYLQAGAVGVGVGGSLTGGGADVPDLANVESMARDLVRQAGIGRTGA